eukprot:COSAG04_NODE_2175_length_4628_cov_4.893133_3_plen_420_part_00
MMMEISMKMMTEEARLRDAGAEILDEDVGGGDQLLHQLQLELLLRPHQLELLLRRTSRDVELGAALRGTASSDTVAALWQGRLEEAVADLVRSGPFGPEKWDKVIEARSGKMSVDELWAALAPQNVREHQGNAEFIVRVILAPCSADWQRIEPIAIVAGIVALAGAQHYQWALLLYGSSDYWIPVLQMLVAVINGLLALVCLLLKSVTRRCCGWRLPTVEPKMLVKKLCWIAAIIYLGSVGWRAVELFAQDRERASAFDSWAKPAKALATAQLETVKGVMIEGHPDSEYNGRYLHDFVQDGWPVLKNDQGIYCYRHTARGQVVGNFKEMRERWFLSRVFLPDLLNSCSEEPKEEFGAALQRLFEAPPPVNRFDLAAIGATEGPLPMGTHTWALFRQGSAPKLSDYTLTVTLLVRPAPSS